GDEEPNECAKYDNYNHHIKDNPIIRNVIPDIEELLRVVEVLTTIPHRTEYISCTLVIEGLVDGSKEIVKEQKWKYW
ncbi:14453_t:CDS:2, partial [Gigaspora rosea]